LHKDVRGNIFEHNATCGNDRSCTNLDTGSDESRRSHLASRAQCDGRNFQFEIFPSKSVTPCAKISALADADIGFNCDLAETENSHVFADPDMIANLQSPRERNVYVSTNDNALADFRTEQFEQREAQIGRPGQGILEEETAREHPKRFLPPRPAAINSESFRESKSELL
jgi:hypothetical protein